MPSFRSLIVAFLVVSLVVIISGCGGSSHVTGPSRFSATKIQSVKIGMPMVAIDTLFGKPDVITTMEFGKKTEKTWTGIVYKYYTVKDSKFKSFEVYLTNTFVFVRDVVPPALNNWSIEYTAPIPADR